MPRFKWMKRTGLAAAAWLLWAAYLPAQAQAQQQNQVSQTASEPTAGLNYAGEKQLRNAFVLAVHSSATHDDNVFSDNSRRQGDLLFNEGASMALQINRPLWALDLDYRPDVVLYRTTQGFNEVNHGLVFDGSVRVTPHLSFRLNDLFAYRTGALEPRSNADSSAPLGPPPSLNSTLFTPAARELSNQGLLSAEYQTSRRATFKFSAGSELRRFSDLGASAPSLLNTRAVTGGAEFEYRLEPRVTLGARYFFQDFHFGSAATAEIHSAYLILLWEAGPHASLTLYGGPQYSHSEDQFLPPTSPPGVPPSPAVTVSLSGWHPAVGGSLTLRSDATVLRLTGQRKVTDGGGLQTSVTSTYGGAELRRRLPGECDLVLSAGRTHSASFTGPAGQSVVNAFTAGAAFERPLTENLLLHFGYNFARQRVNQNTLFGTDLDRNRFTLGLFYQFGAHRFRESSRESPEWTGKR